MSLSKCLDQHIRMLDREDYDSVRVNARALENGGMPRAEAEKAAVKRVLEDVNESANDLRRQLADQGVDVAVRPIKEKSTPKSAPKLPEDGTKVEISKPEPKPIPNVGRTTAEQKAVAADSRPDLANPGSSEAVRDMVRKARVEMVTPERRAQEQSMRDGKDLLKDDTKRSALLQKIKDGGILNDIETAAFLQHLDSVGDKSIEAGGEKLREIMKLSQGYTSGGTEQGRAFAMRRDRNETPLERRKAALIRAIIMPSERTEQTIQRLRDKLQRAAPSEKALHQAGIEKIEAKEFARVERFKKRMIGLGYDLDNMDMLYQNESKVAAIVDEARIDKASMHDAVYEWWLTSILSGIKTNTTNLLGNLGNIGLHEIERFAQMPVGKVVDFLTSKTGSGPSAGELVAVWGTLLSTDAWGFAKRHLMDSFAAERPMLDAEIAEGRELSRDEAKMASNQGNKYLSHAPVNKNIAAKAVRSVGTRIMMAVDQFFKGLVARSEVAGRAYKLAKENGYKPGSPEFAEFMAQEVGDLESQSWEYAYLEAKRLTFAKDPGKITKKVIELRNATVVGKWIIPFIPVLVNLIGRGMTIAPVTAQINVLQRAVRGGLFRYDPTMRGVLPYARNEIVQDIVANLAGLLAYSIIAGWAGDDEDGLPRITGTSTRWNSVEDEAVPAKSIRLGGSYVSYDRIDPFASVVASAVDLFLERSKKQPDYAQMAFKNLSYQVLDKSFMSTLSEAAKGLDAEEGKVAGITSRYLRSTLVGFVPNIIRQSINMSDEDTKDQKAYARASVSSGDWWTEQGRLAAGSAIGGLPFVPKIDMWGEKRKTGQPFDQVASDFTWRLLLPVNVREGNASNAYEQALYNWNKTAEKPSWPRYPNGYLERKDGTRWYYTSEQYNDMLRERGRILMDNLGEWKPEDPLKPKDWEIKRIRNAMTLASKLARLPYVQKLGYEPVRAADEDQ